MTLGARSVWLFFTGLSLKSSVLYVSGALMTSVSSWVIAWSANSSVSKTSHANRSKSLLFSGSLKITCSSPLQIELTASCSYSRDTKTGTCFKYTVQLLASNLYICPCSPLISILSRLVKSSYGIGIDEMNFLAFLVASSLCASLI